MILCYGSPTKLMQLGLFSDKELKAQGVKFTAQFHSVRVGIQTQAPLSPKSTCFPFTEWLMGPEFNMKKKVVLRMDLHSLHPGPSGNSGQSGLIMNSSLSKEW